MVDSLAGLPAQADADPVPDITATKVLAAAAEVLLGFDLESAPPAVNTSAFRARVGLAAGGQWTAGAVRRGLAVLAACAGESADWLGSEVAADRRRAVRWYAREYRDAYAKRAGLEERRRLAPSRKVAAALLPPAERADLVVRYEAHLQKVLTTTLRELERFQAVRVGRDGPVSLVVDVTSTGPAAGGAR